MFEFGNAVRSSSVECMAINRERETNVCNMIYVRVATTNEQKKCSTTQPKKINFYTHCVIQRSSLCHMGIGHWALCSTAAVKVFHNLIALLFILSLYYFTHFALSGVVLYRCLFIVKRLEIEKFLLVICIPGFCSFRCFILLSDQAIFQFTVKYLCDYGNTITNSIRFRQCDRTMRSESERNRNQATIM